MVETYNLTGFRPVQLSELFGRYLLDMDIKKIIREEIENSWDWAEDIKPMTPQMKWLKDNFSNLKQLPPNGYGKVFYVDSKQKKLFFHYLEGNDDIFIDNTRIWSKLEEDFGLKYTEIQDVITEWLWEVYNLRGFTPKLRFFVE